jgi:hypothetical protein
MSVSLHRNDYFLNASLRDGIKSYGDYYEQ